MLHEVLPRTRIVVWTLGLLLSLAGGVAAHGQDEFLPFRSIEGSGSITVAGGDVFFRLDYDADFRLDPKSDGIQPGDDVQIVTSAAYPVPDLQAARFGLPIQRLVVRLLIHGQCFERRGRTLLFKAADEGAIAGCAEVVVQVLDGQGRKLFEADLDQILRAVSVELSQVGRRGRWKLSSAAAFADPGFPFPVAGFEADAAGGPTGITLIVGDDGLLAPFRGVAFRTLAP